VNFKIGDSLVYISHGGEWHQDAKLVIGKIYIISNIYEYNKNRFDIDLYGQNFSYEPNRFILLTEYRKLKIRKLKNTKTKK
jgi:hypothetical protein